MKKLYLIILTLFLTTATFAGFTRTPEFGNDESTNVIAWSDYNDDGYPDLAVGNSGIVPTNRLYINDTAGGFNLAPDPFGDGETYTLAWGDYNNDGFPDLSVGNHDGQDFLYENDGAGGFTAIPHFTTTEYPYTMSWADYDLDNDIDLALGNWDNAQNYLYENLGSTNFSYHLEFGLNDTFGMNWADFDHDGDADMAVVNGDSTAQNYYYRNEGDGNFTVFPEFGTATNDNRSGASGDYDNDGDLDFAVSGFSATLSRLYTNEGSANFSSSEPFETDAAILNTCVAWGDYDNDGDLDLAMGSSSTHSTKLYTNNGGSFSESSLPSSGEYTTSLGWADFDKDGDLDLAVSDIYGQSYLYVNDQNDTLDDEYLSVHVVGDGVTTNIQGIGAYVKLFEAGHAGDYEYFLSFREVNADNSGGQNYIDPFFGIPGFSQVDVVAGWPANGKFYESEFWAFVDVGGEFEAVEGTGTPLRIDDGDTPNNPRGFYLASAVPNPSNGNAVISYVIPKTTDARLELFDIKGRKIATLAEGEHQPGEYSVSVKGLSSGIYLYRLTADEFSDAKKMVVK
ncbi:MAG: T9SS type A sorting domain-containing protein [bacterium]|nr:T9SS type A sorting domain-containing protein [bacterium]